MTEFLLLTDRTNQFPEGVLRGTGHCCNASINTRYGEAQAIFISGLCPSGCRRPVEGHLSNAFLPATLISGCISLWNDWSPCFQSLPSSNQLSTIRDTISDLVTANLFLCLNIFGGSSSSRGSSPHLKPCGTRPRSSFWLDLWFLPCAS